MKTILLRNPLGVATVAIALVLIVTGCGKTASKTQPTPDPQIEAKLAAIRQAGEPVTLAECNAAYAEPPAAENAAPLYAEAFAALTADAPQSPAFVARNQKALALLHQAAAKSRCRYAIDLNAGENTQLAHLAKIRRCAQLLEQEALLNAGKDRMDLAAQSVLAGLRLGRSLEAEPVLVSQLVRLAVEQIAVSGLEQAINRRPFSEPQLAELQAAFREAESADAAAIARSLATERCMGIAFFQSPAQEQRKQLGALGNAGSISALEDYRKTPTYNADFNFCLDQMSNLIAAANAPFPEGLDAASQWVSEVSDVRSKGYLISGLLMPALAKTLEKSATAVAALRAVEAAVAVERYRLAHNNALPDSLNQLVPQYSTAVPSDPFDGQPLRYRKASPEGFVVYSLGPDRQDDGGTPKPPDAAAGAHYDVTFAVRR